MEPQSSFQCEFCKTLTGKELAHHIANIHNRWSCVVPSCNVQLKGYGNLRDHMNKEHKALKEKEVFCSMCDNKSKNFGGWGRHASSEHYAAVEVDHSSSTLDISWDLDDDDSLQSCSSAGAKTARATRTENVFCDVVSRQSKRNGVPIFAASKELEGDLHVIRIGQRISLRAHKETEDGAIEDFERGTKASSGCKRAQETNMLNNIIKPTTGDIRREYMNGKGELTKTDKEHLETLQLEATGNLFKLKMESDSVGKSWKVGLSMSTGHLGNELLGQVATDTNLIVKTQSCNVKYCKIFEVPLQKFVDGVKEIDKETNAFVKVQYFVPDYGTLVHTDKSKNTLEIPFAPEFNVQFSLENNTNPKIQVLFDEIFKDLRPSGEKSGGIYSVSFTNDYPSKNTVHDDSPLNPTSSDIELLSSSLKSTKLS